MEKENIIFGVRPVIEAINAGKEIDKLYIQRDIKGSGLSELRNAVKKAKIAFSHVPIQKINKHTSGNHQGVLAFITPIELSDIETLIPTLFNEGKTPFILVLDKLTDVRNFGAIARTAECAGVHAIVVPKRESAQINADAIKTSAGALHKIPVCKVNNLTDTVMFLQASGINIVGCTEKTENSIYSVDYTSPIAIVMGSEEKGISNQILKICDDKTKIPMIGEISSLNVSVAAGIILFEAVKQRAIT
ncbi:MAG: 23S rRNA (guanosine(2251)-2'-O)-methyltransferase RlmB [Flavobacteriales bacterium]|nr:MAG: 23S rRNA (guanosine(2251)-2'-O)-methyltransferase RlmB [Flavobacteriales bacterium]